MAHLIAVAVVTTIPLLLADDPTDQTGSSEGYKTISVRAGGKTVPVRVREETDPFKNISTANSTGKYDPEHIFSSTSAMAHKQFEPGSASLGSRNSDFQNPDQNTFITKAYVPEESSPSARSVANLNTKVSLPTAGGFERNAAGFDRSFGSGSDVSQNKRAVLASSTASSDQNRTASLGTNKTETFAANFANKQYLGPGAQDVPDGINIKGNVVLSRMSSLPNRPLSIDEVRNLINHGTAPDTNVKPEPPSKPLNDPGYKPEPLRDTPSPGADDDKNDPIPSPGMMASPQAPENSEPLPQP